MPTPEETADKVAKARLELEAAEAEHAAALDEGEANKPPEAILADLLEVVVMRQGNRPDARALLKRFAKSVYPAQGVTGATGATGATGSASTSGPTGATGATGPHV